MRMICIPKLHVSEISTSVNGLQRETHSTNFYVNPLQILSVEKGCYKFVECTCVTLTNGEMIPTRTSVESILSNFELQTRK